MRAIFVIFLATWSSVTATYIPNIKNITEILPILHKCKPPLPFSKICIKESMKSMKPYLSDGVPQLNIPSFNTYMINKTFNLTEEFDGTVQFKDMKINGLTTYRIRDLCNVQISTNMSQIHFDAFFPQINMSTKYRLLGILSQHEVVNGQYSVAASYQNITASIIMFLTNVPFGGLEYFELNRVNLTSNIGQIVIEHKNIYLQDMTEIENYYVERVWEKIMPELRLQLDKFAAKLIKRTANKIYDNVPISMLMSDEST